MATDEQELGWLGFKFMIIIIIIILCFHDEKIGFPLNEGGVEEAVAKLPNAYDVNV